MKKRKTPILKNHVLQEKTHNIDDTIVAVATPLGVGAIGIIKLSGKHSIDIISGFCRTRSKRDISRLPNFKLTLCDIFDTELHQALDEGLIVLMRGPFSYTREDVVEIQIHSNPFIVQRIVQICIDHGARLADPGEFTRRAFMNGRIALSQAEAVAEMVKAQSEQALICSFRSLQGLFGEKITLWQKSLVSIQAYIQAECDFPGHFIDDIQTLISKEINAIVEDIEKQYDRSKKYQLMQHGFLVMICGKPNVGKSSLLNSILGKDRAIVTPIPGTTRDAIEEVIQIDGFPFRFVDTAGIRESHDTIEKIGIDKARQYLEEAHLVIVIFDRSQDLQDEDYKIVELVKQKPHIIVLNKSDLMPKLDISQIGTLYPRKNIIEISALSGNGVDDLIHAIIEETRWMKNDYENDYFAINTRQQKELSQSVKYLGNVMQALEMDYPIDILSLDIDYALRCLKRINGEDIDQDILDTIFTSFCLGK